jgi:predicted HAD superfamily Cof-like phosphohydrolase
VTNFDRVKEFHEWFGCHTRKRPGHISDEEKMLRTRLMSEELAELVAAMQLEDIPLVADSIADLLYVVYGTAVSYGIPIQKVFEEVHRSNMTKSTNFDEGGKVTKGINFEPPDLNYILFSEGYDPDDFGEE